MAGNLSQKQIVSPQGMFDLGVADSFSPNFANQRKYTVNQEHVDPNMIQNFHPTQELENHSPNAISAYDDQS